ncbi:flavodoxin, partial [Enterococcus faecium]
DSEPCTRFPRRRVWPDMFSVFKAQGRGETGEIRTPDAVRAGDYDLVLFGSPTWWDTVSMPLRSFLVSKEAGPLLGGTPYAVVTV